VDASTALRDPDPRRHEGVLMLIGAMFLLLLGAHVTVLTGTAVANSLGVNPIIVGLLIVGLGTTLPELFYSLKAVKRQDDDLAVGDILGTVLADATVLVGIIALINPFDFSATIVSVTGAFMISAALLLMHFMKTGRIITRKEGYLLLVFWLAYALIEVQVNR
jgi:cation:H+ antiporter